MDIETAFILLFVVATAVAIAARRLRLPYTVALVLTGLILGALKLFPAPHLTKNLLFAAFLPGLIFEAAFHIQWREFRDNLITILTLAVPGVIASTALVAFVLPIVFGAFGVTPGFGWRHALVFGALISATDPVAVVALFRSLGAPHRLTTLLDGESLLNDGTAIVFFALSLSLVAGTATTAGTLTLQFASIVGVGAGVGALIGAVASVLMRKIDDPMIEITLTTIAAYGSFVTAETLNASGVIATVGAGMLCGNLGARTGMSASTRLASESLLGIRHICPELDCVSADWVRSPSADAALILDSDPGGLSDRYRRTGFSHHRRSRTIGPDSRTLPLVLDCRTHMGRPARRITNGPGAQSS